MPRRNIHTMKWCMNQHYLPCTGAEVEVDAIPVKIGVELVGFNVEGIGVDLVGVTVDNKRSLPPKYTNVITDKHL